MSPTDPFTELEQFDIDPRSVRLVPEDWCREHQAVVLGVVDPDDESAVSVGVTRPELRAVLRQVERRLGRKVRPVRLNPFEIRRALDLGWGRGDPAGDRSVLELGPVGGISFRDGISVAELVDQILSRAVETGASDIHIETYAHDVDVRFRIDGELRQVSTPLAVDNVAQVVARLKILADLDIAERRRAQDGRIRATWTDRHQPEGSRPLDFRLSVVPGPAGEDAVLRVLDRGAAFLELEHLGLHGDDLATFERMVTNPEGLVLVTGPTGSGKTTTLYAALHRINTPANKILTAENPIEYRFPKTNQKQISPTMGFADYARAFLRQNPDVILIGEVRDEETADAAVRAAQTGHLVLSTLHTNDAVRTVSRLATLGVETSMISSTLLGALSQRLVRRICRHCQHETPATADQARLLGLDPAETFFSGAGCEACDGKGTKGRTGIYELFELTSDLADRVAAGAPAHELRQRARDGGMKTLLDDALAKARSGVIPLAEIVRQVPYRMLQSRA